MTFQRRFVALIAGFVVFAIAVAVVLFSRRSMPSGAANNAVTNSPSASTNGNLSTAASRSATTNGLASSEPLFPIAHETTFAKWTDADGKDTNVIRQLAHNPLEYARMVDENPRIFRRQLVYLKETAAAVFEKAKLTGDPVQQLTLPGLDGQELRFEITKRESQVSSRAGMFRGRLVGNSDSLVTLAYEDGRQAFTILSPKDNLFLVGEPREDGQVIVKAIDPNSYGVGPAETADTTTTQPTIK